MALPSVAGWVVDFRTAREIWASGSNVRIDHCVGQCVAGAFHICHCEEPSFKSLPKLRAAFLDDQNCVHVPDADIMDRCIAVSGHPKGQRVIRGNQAALFITAIAAAKNFGVISDHRSTKFATVFDLCVEFGIPVMSADDYFNALEARHGDRQPSLSLRLRVPNRV